MQNIGSVQQEQGQVERAFRSYLRVAEIQDNYLPVMHPHRARTFNSIAVLSAENGDYRTAMTFLNKALAIQERTLPKNHIELAIIHSNMADCLTSLRQFNDALIHATTARCYNFLFVGQSLDLTLLYYCWSVFCSPNMI